MTFKDIIPFRRKTSSDYMPLANIQQQMGDIFDRFFTDWDVFPSLTCTNHFPALNVSETENDVMIKAELPGMDEKDIKIEVNKNQMTIRGEKRNETEEKDKEGTYYLKEISQGIFCRTVGLPFDLDTTKTKASFSKGMLTVTIEKPEGSISESKAIPISVP